MRANVEVPDWARRLVSDDTDMTRAARPLNPATTPEVEFDFPDDGYYEYGFMDERGRLHADPGNALRANNPWYPEVSALTGPRYAADPYAALDRSLERGHTSRLRLTSTALNGQLRRATVYTPLGHEGAELPLVVAQDGVAFNRLAGLHLVGEQLAARVEARPARFLFVEPVDRNSEYAYSTEYLDFLFEELLPKVEAENPGTGERVWLGASLGGLAAAAAALARPDLATSVVTFSGAFVGDPESMDFYSSRDSWLLERLADPQAAPPPRWYLEVGTIEWLNDVNRRVAAALGGRGVDVALTERHAGHNWTNWRNGMASALRFVLRP